MNQHLLPSQLLATQTEQSITILYGKITLRLKDIVRIEGHRNYSCFVLANGQQIMTSQSLCVYQKNLPSSFIRVHKSSIVNQQYIRCFDNCQIMLTNGLQIAVARRKKYNVLTQLYAQQGF